VRAAVAGSGAATATYTTPKLTLGPRGTFDRTWIDSVILSPFLMVFVIVSVLALLSFAILTAFDVRSRSIRRRMAQYVQVPTEEESNLRRAEVASMLANRAQKQVAGQRWWQSFEKDVELSGYSASPVTIAGWTLVCGILASIVAALLFQSLLGLLVGLAAPVVLRVAVKRRVSKKRQTFGEQLPDNLDVLAGALRAGHSLIGAMNVMVEGADEPSKTEFRRVLQDEQLGVPIDQALMVTAGRMENLDIEQVAIVTRLQREAGGNSAEVIDRVVENIRGRMEIRRLIRVLTAQGRLARWILTLLPIVLVGFLLVINPAWLDPLKDTNIGRAFLVLWVVMLIAGSIVIKKIVEIEV
jgi:tight adherence protein B